MELKIHQIDDPWSLHERALGVELVGSHTGQDMSNVLMCILKEYNLHTNVKLGTFYFIVHVKHYFKDGFLFFGF